MLVVGGLWWVLLTIVVVIELLWAIHKHHPIVASISFIAYVAVLQWLSHVPIFSSIAEHPALTILLIFSYLMLGIIWSFIRWWLYLRRICNGKESLNGIRITKDFKQKWITDQQRQGNVVTPEDWKNYLQEIQPKVTENRSLIILWIVYWPFSALWCLVEDLIHEALKSIVMRLRTIYDSIGYSVMKDIS